MTADWMSEPRCGVCGGADLEPDRFRCVTPACVGMVAARGPGLHDRLVAHAAAITALRAQVAAGLEHLRAVITEWENLDDAFVSVAAVLGAAAADAPDAPVPAAAPHPNADTRPVTSLPQAMYADGTAAEYIRNHPDERVVPGVS